MNSRSERLPSPAQLCSSSLTTILIAPFEPRRRCVLHARNLLRSPAERFDNTRSLLQPLQTAVCTRWQFQQVSLALRRSCACRKERVPEYAFLERRVACSKTADLATSASRSSLRFGS